MKSEQIDLREKKNKQKEINTLGTMRRRVSMGVGRIKTLFSFTVNHMNLSAGKQTRAKNDLAFKYLVDIFCGHVPNESTLCLPNDYLQTTVNLSAPRSPAD